MRGAGAASEQVRYSAYGIPFGLPAGDADSSGSVTSGDVSQISAWAGAPAYDVRGDINLDGVVDSADVTLASSLQGDAMGWKVLSLADVGNRKGYAGYESCFTRDTLWHVRYRVLESELGRWTRRDPLGYVDGNGLYQYVGSRPIIGLDPDGRVWWVAPAIICGACLGIEVPACDQWCRTQPSGPTFDCVFNCVMDGPCGLLCVGSGFIVKWIKTWWRNRKKQQDPQAMWNGSHEDSFAASAE
jgi:RHS repeat-associated protein